MGYNPNAAPDREPLSFKNHVRCVVNDIISVQEAVERGRMREVPEKVDPEQPYLDLQYESLDAKFDDGGGLNVSSGAKLFTLKRDGSGKYRMADKTMRPSKIAAAFRGLGIEQFPGDPEGKFDAWCKAHLDPTDPCADGIGDNSAYDEAQVVGNCFVVEKPPRNREDERDPANFAAPLPTTVLGSDYTYTDDVRIIPRNRSNTNEQGQNAPSTVNTIDILKDDDAAAKVLDAINGKEADSLDDALTDAGIDHNLLINGESVMGAAVTGKLASALEQAGLIEVKKGFVKVLSLTEQLESA